MPQFYFHLSRGVHHVNAEGTSLPDLEAAKVEAVRVAGQLLFSDPQKIIRHPHVTLSVSQGGSIVYSLKVKAG